jgi:hypothetical protein
MLQQATRDATLYAVEAQRTVILPRDIELALKRLIYSGRHLKQWSYLLAGRPLGSAV